MQQPGRGRCLRVCISDKLSGATVNHPWRSWDLDQVLKMGKLNPREGKVP